jgi:hypothetical protein
MFASCRDAALAFRAFSVTYCLMSMKPPATHLTTYKH